MVGLEHEKAEEPNTSERENVGNGVRTKDARPTEDDPEHELENAVTEKSYYIPPIRFTLSLWIPSMSPSRGIPSFLPHAKLGKGFVWTFPSERDATGIFWLVLSRERLWPFSST